MFKASPFLAGAALLATSLSPLAVSAQVVGQTTTGSINTHFSAGVHAHGPRGPQHGPKNMVFGKVSAINGNTLTVTGQNQTSYTIDVTSAKLSKGFMKNAATITLADIKVGDMVSATGTITSTSVVATSLNDMGTPPVGGHRPTGMGTTKRTHAPMVMGTISAVSGNTLTLAARNNTTYDVDATNAKITKGFGKNATTEPVAALTTGDHIAATGSLNGTTVTATSIMDLGTKLPTFGGKGLGFHGHKPQTSTTTSE